MEYAYQVKTEAEEVDVRGWKRETRRLRKSKSIDGGRELRGPRETRVHIS